MQMLMSDPYLPFQLLLQADSHGERLRLLEEMVEEVILPCQRALTILFLRPLISYTVPPCMINCNGTTAVFGIRLRLLADSLLDFLITLAL